MLVKGITTDDLQSWKLNIKRPCWYYSLSILDYTSSLIDCCVSSSVSPSKNLLLDTEPRTQNYFQLLDPQDGILRVSYVAYLHIFLILWNNVLVIPFDDKIHYSSFNQNLRWETCFAWDEVGLPWKSPC